MNFDSTDDKAPTIVDALLALTSSGPFRITAEQRQYFQLSLAPAIRRSRTGVVTDCPAGFPVPTRATGRLHRALTETSNSV